MQNRILLPENQVSWRQMLAGLLIFFTPIVMLLGNFMGWVRIYTFLAGFFIVAILILTLVAFAKGFPRWSMPYSGIFFILFCFMIVLSLSPLLRYISSFNIFTQRPGDETGRFFAGFINSGMLWFLISAASGLYFLILSFFSHFRTLVQQLRQDWTLASFFLYGIIAFALFMSFEEYRGEEFYLAGGQLFLLTGAGVYLRSNTTRTRILALLTGLTLAWWIAALGKWMIVPQQDWPQWFAWHPPQEERWFEAFSQLGQWIWVGLAMFSPLLFIRILPRRKEEVKIA